MLSRDLQVTYNKALAAYNQRAGEAKAIERRKAGLVHELDKLESEVISLGKALAILGTLSAEVQERFIDSIESLVTDGLQAIFGSDVRFQITPSIKNKMPVLEFNIVTPEGTQDDILDSHGGGLVAVCGVILRMIMVRLLRHRIRQVVFLDEPLAQLSSEYVDAAGEVLARLAEDLGIQIVMISHQEGFSESADYVYHLGRVNGVVAAERVK